MIVFGILRDLVNRPIANGLLQIVATSTTNSVFIGSSVYMKADNQGHYQFELLPGTYTLYAQPSKQSDVEYLGETVVTDKTSDGSLNSLVGITVPILPKLVQQTIDAANQAMLSARDVKGNIERNHAFMMDIDSKVNEAEAKAQQIDVLVQSVTDSAAQIHQALSRSQQVKADTLGLYDAARTIHSDIYGIQQQVLVLRNKIESFSDSATSSLQKAKAAADMAVLSERSTAAKSQQTFNFMHLAKQYRDETLKSVRQSQKVLLQLESFRNFFNEKLNDIVQIEAQIDTHVINANRSQQASRQSQLAARESALQAAQEVERAKVVMRIDIANEAKNQADRSHREAERAHSSAQLSQTAKESAQQSANDSLVTKQQVLERGADVEHSQQQIQEQVDISARHIQLAQHSAVAAGESATVATQKANVAIQQVNTAKQEAANTLANASKAEASEHSAQSSAAIALDKSNVSTEKAVSVSLGLSQTLTAKETAVEAARRAELAAASLSGAMLEQGGIDLSSGIAPSPLIDINGEKRACFWKVTVAGTVNGIEYGIDDSLVYSASMGTYYKIDNTESVTSINGKRGVVLLSKADVDLEHVPNTVHTVEANANSVPVRDSNGDIQARLFSSGFSNQSVFSGALAFRIDNVADSYIRFCSNQDSIRQWLETYSKAESDTRYVSAKNIDSLVSNKSPQCSGKMTIEGLDDGGNVTSEIQLYAKSGGGHTHPIPKINHNDGYDNDGMMYKYKNIFAGAMTYEFLKSLPISIDGNINKYVRIAAVYIPQNGCTAEIEIIGGSGFSVNSYCQCDHNRIIIRSGNGDPVGVTCVVYSHTSHDERFFTKIHTHNIARDWFDVYLFVVNPYANQLIFKFNASNGSYIKANLSRKTLTYPPSSSQKGRIYQYTYTQDDID
ncbi:hypothetical protein CTM97_21020 [Photobacterium phosphoreum]|uniref:Lambda-like tail fibre protein N-terminal domain-containing protein n=1 Tax=Photobacterium phosphoreum TaxID=659 RepID=A0A2T3JBB7_PHOPO|nr:hypothetical protein [Photobacterium phosphoreum]PSU19620.1 hypothetical protein CTM96_21015 [Photobacterium phosphoreum]PSU37065.1 hypothetical protein CTM97_21020 [Photobacterium phosphoreum]PSU46157.1 hypothetical protein C9J18_21065 [Photobacterium phosphoreum]